MTSAYSAIAACTLGSVKGRSTSGTGGGSTGGGSTGGG
ncbi:MAG: ABC transporter substrate-binding protein, partial [Myxococcaceae bacterium]